MEDDLLTQPNQKLIKSGDLVVDLPSFENGFQREKERYQQEIWDYVQYRESLVKWPPANEKIKMGTSLNHG
jgi:GTP-binding protein EngB required for normal cell division